MVRSVWLLVVILACVATTLNAQASHDAAGVRLAVRAVFAKFGETVDTAREAPDSESVWRRFVHCDVRDGRTVCALNSGKPAIAITVKLITPDSAEVRVQEFHMQYNVCPGGPPLNPPVINGHLGYHAMTFKYVDDRWVNVGRLPVTTC